MRKLRVCFSFVFVAVVAMGLAACGDDDSDLSSRADQQPDDVLAPIDDQSDSTVDSLTEDEPENRLNEKENAGKNSSSSKKTSSSSSKKASSSSGKESVSSSSESKSSDSGKDKGSSSSESSSSAVSSSSMPTSSSRGKDGSLYDAANNTLTDYRDGQIYRTTSIGIQTWMAENLNYVYLQPTAELDSSSFCYNDSVSYCEKYGRLYLWSAAMDSVGTWSTNGMGCGYGKTCSPAYPVRGVCPEGWHLPIYDEWMILFANVGGASTAAAVLKTQMGWKNGNGSSDAFGFSALPAGYYGDGGFLNEGYGVYFWNATEGNDNDAYHVFLGYPYHDNAFLGNGSKYREYSVRCIKDDIASDMTQSVDPSTVVKGVMTDERDGQTYKIVTIGTQTWMAENLNYAYTGVPYNYKGFTSDSTSWCYDNNPDNCTKYGRLYSWSAAMDSAGTWTTNGKGCGDNITCFPTYPVRGVCPESWHLPTRTEWNTLFTAVGGLSMACKMLKFASGWYDNGLDAYSFAALPAGFRSYDENYYDMGGSAGFWSSTEYESNKANYVYLYYCDKILFLSNFYKESGTSVRCLKD